LGQFYGNLTYYYVTDNGLVGNYGVAQNFVVLITFFATPVTTMLFPAFSKLDPQKDKELFKNVFQASVKYAALIVVPVTVLVMVLAQPGIGTIFGNKFSEAPLFLALLSIGYLFAALGNLSVGNLINGQGYTGYNLKLTILTTGIGIPVSFVLISQFGIIGLIVTSLTVSLPSYFISLGFIRKRFGVSVDWVSSAKIMLSSAVAGVLTFVLISDLSFSNPMKLVIGVPVFVVVFILVAVATRTVNKVDLNNLRGVVDGLGPLRKPLRFILSIIEKLMTVFRVK
jgi:putative peptidoglycan lipid II flippase